MLVRARAQTFSTTYAIRDHKHSVRVCMRSTILSFLSFLPPSIRVRSTNTLFFARSNFYRRLGISMFRFLILIIIDEVCYKQVCYRIETPVPLKRNP